MTRRRAQRIIDGYTIDPRVQRPLLTEYQQAVARVKKPSVATRAWRQVRTVPSFVWWFAILVIIIMIMVVALAVGGVSATTTASATRSHRPASTDAAIIFARVRCHGHAETYDVQDRNLLVYACRNGKLRVLPYGN